jgi:hypothetical protein
MKRIKPDLVMGAIDIGLRTDKPFSLIIATDDKDQATHYAVILTREQVAESAVHGVIPIKMNLADFE